MAAALAHQNALNSRTTARAILPAPAEHLELIGIAAPATGHRVEISRTTPQGRTHVPQPGTQNIRYGPVQGCDFFLRKRTADTQRVNLGLPERFVHVYVAQTGNKFLVQQQRFDLTSAGLEHLAKTGHNKIICQGFGPQFSQDSPGVFGEKKQPNLRVS